MPAPSPLAPVHPVEGNHRDPGRGIRIGAGVLLLISAGLAYSIRTTPNWLSKEEDMGTLGVAMAQITVLGMAMCGGVLAIALYLLGLFGFKSDSTRPPISGGDLPETR